MDHTVLPANNTTPAFPSWAFTRPVLTRAPVFTTILAIILTRPSLLDFRPEFVMWSLSFGRLAVAIVRRRNVRIFTALHYRSTLHAVKRQRERNLQQFFFRAKPCSCGIYTTGLVSVCLQSVTSHPCSIKMAIYNASLHSQRCWAPIFWRQASWWKYWWKAYV